MYNPQQPQQYNSFPSGEMSPIDPTTKAQYDNKFYELVNRDPNKKFLSGSEGRQFLMQSGLPLDVLGLIWELSDMDKDGNLDRDEFAVAFHLTKGAIRGIKPISPLPAFLVPKSKEMYIQKQANTQSDWTQFDGSQGQFQVTVPLSNPSPYQSPQSPPYSNPPPTPQNLNNNILPNPSLNGTSTPLFYQPPSNYPNAIPNVPNQSLISSGNGSNTPLSYQNPSTYQNPNLLHNPTASPSGVLRPDQVNPANFSVMPSVPSNFRTQQEIELQRKKEIEKLQEQQLKQAQQNVLRQEQEKYYGVQSAILAQGSANLQQQQLLDQMQKSQGSQNAGYSPTPSYGNTAVSPYPSPSPFSPQPGTSSPQQTPSFPSVQTPSFNPYSPTPVVSNNFSLPNNVPSSPYNTSPQSSFTPNQTQVRSQPTPTPYSSPFPVVQTPVQQNLPNPFSQPQSITQNVPNPFSVQQPSSPFSSQSSQFPSQPFTQNPQPQFPPQPITQNVSNPFPAQQPTSTPFSSQLLPQPFTQNATPFSSQPQPITQNTPNQFSSVQTPSQPVTSNTPNPFSSSDPFGSYPAPRPSANKPPLPVISKSDPFGGASSSTSEFSGLTFEPPVLQTKKNGPSDGYALGPSVSFEQRLNFGSDLEKAMEKLRTKNRAGSM